MLYLLPLGSIFKKYGISFHLYADDLQLYLPFKLNGNNTLGALYACIQELKIFVISRLYYCNSLYYGINCLSMECLQLVQDAAARLLTGTCKFQHIS